MPEFLQLTGMDQAIPNTNTKEIRFLLNVSDGEPVKCAARYGVAAQIASGLGTALRVLRMALSEQGAWERVAVDQLQEVHVQKNPLSGQVVVQLTTILGIPYTFEIPPQNAIELADRLRTEGSKDHPMGSA